MLAPNEVETASSEPALVWMTSLVAYEKLTAGVRMPERPTAIFASNDLMAFGVMEAVRDCGLRIPGDISVIGFDDIPQTTHVHPPLTTIRQPLEQMGRIATRMLLEQIGNPAAEPARIELPTELIIRASCRSLP